jgi:hypothetical protein
VTPKTISLLVQAPPGRPDRPVRPILAALAQAGLLAEQPAGSGRWRMHDLIGLYAAQLAHAERDGDQRQEAVDRLLEYYLVTADAADDHLRALPGDRVPLRPISVVSS